MYKSKQRKAKRLIAGLVVLVVLAAGIYAFAIAGNGESDGTSHGDSEAIPANTVPEGVPPFMAQVHISDIVDTQYLKLVNRDHGIATPVSSGQLVTVWPDIPARANDVTLRESAFSALRELFAAAGHANINGLFIASGFRSNDEQSDLYANAADPAYVMPPGHSEHQLGLAADILSTYNTSGMRGSEEARWLAENAPRFGLILPLSG